LKKPVSAIGVRLDFDCHMTKMEERRNMAPRVKGILAFLLITFGVTWSVWGVAWLLGVLNTSVSGQIIVAVGAFAPALATFIVRRWVTREGFADAGLRPHLLKKLPYYLVAWLWPLVGVGVIIAVASALGVVSIRSDVAPALVVGALAGALIATPLFFGEEFGWRGYLQLRVASGRPLLAAVVTGLIWGVYHYPVILAGFEGFENTLLGLIVFPITTVLLSIVFGWLRAKTGSVWVTCLAHSATNGVGGALLAYLYLGGGSFVLTSYVGVLGWIPLGLLCLGLLVTGQLRRSRPSVDVSAQAEEARQYSTQNA
jgi:membrane protease YdiL (CAAX protease family)